jgi:hypothetical protein
MRSVLRAGLVLSVAIFAVVGVSGAQEGLTKQDRQGPVTVSVTLLAPPAAAAPLKAKVVLDTHSVALDGIDFEKAVALRTEDGADIAPTALEEATGSGHHRQVVLVFPALTQAGPFRIIVKNVGGVAERSFAWELPRQ